MIVEDWQVPWVNHDEQLQAARDVRGPRSSLGGHWSQRCIGLANTYGTIEDEYPAMPAILVFTGARVLAHGHWVGDSAGEHVACQVWPWAAGPLAKR